MPSITCPICKKLTPIKWDGKDRRWTFWPHGPEDNRCSGSEKPANY